ncbi:MAG: polypeptide-transport-associated domain-containing protein [Acidobacteria bacterium OLB17]|nr:MAG: polypeptide-transport-associated domain-containing protein [Acidobacteria bacterium OLB17]MCZ2391899.1 FtsQ-type POTRA domain-containing protein [Acidobacteriota bacterium]
MAKGKKSKSSRTKKKARRSNVDPQLSESIGKAIVGTVVVLLLLAGIGFLAFNAYRSAVNSSFFDLKAVKIVGTDRSSEEDIRRIVLAGSEKTGVWESDIAGIRQKIETLPFVRSASVSLALPSGIRVEVVERVPVAIVRLDNGDQLVDDSGMLLAPVTKPEPNLPFAMRGWDRSKSPNALEDNLSRIKLYKKMVEDWTDFGLATRVKEVNLANLREPNAVIEDSGRPINVFLAKDNLAKSLKAALEAVAGKGEKVQAVNAAGIYPILEYLNN